ncbi:MAG TPA: hypothetical protein VMZ51_08035 [Acidimicrobiales bacterium]|nr:hypothetical protein [Acidimicrobiales bacterium]
MSESDLERKYSDALRDIDRIRTCRACGHDLLAQHDPEDGTCDAFSGDIEVGVCPCGRTRVSHGDRVLTLIERLWHSEKLRRRSDDLVAVLRDLDRCEHGRHEGDVCGGESGCNGPSKGNPIAQDRVIGFGLSRGPIRIPERGKGYDAADWRSA